MAGQKSEIHRQIDDAITRLNLSLLNLTNARPEIPRIPIGPAVSHAHYRAQNQYLETMITPHVIAIYEAWRDLHRGTTRMSTYVHNVSSLKYKAKGKARVMLDAARTHAAHLGPQIVEALREIEHIDLGRDGNGCRAELLLELGQ